MVSLICHAIVMIVSLFCCLCYQSIILLYHQKREKNAATSLLPSDRVLGCRYLLRLFNRWRIHSIRNSSSTIVLLSASFYAV